MSAGLYHHDLRAVRWIPPFSYTAGLAALMRKLPPRPAADVAGVIIDEVRVNETVSLRVMRPAAQTRHVPVLLWFHGGGHLFGSPEQDDSANIALVRELGIVVAAARYRLGATAPAPASVDDGYASLLYLQEHAAELRIDASRIAVGGASAGGGVAAGVVLVAHDRGEVAVAFQLLVYPMLDDRTVVRRDLDARGVRMWTPRSNRLGWTAYLGVEPGSADVSAYAAPARRAELSGLPPTWIGVGTVDLFHDEDVDFARRLAAAGVRCNLEMVPGAFHGFDQLFPRTTLVRSFRRNQMEALRANGLHA